MERTREADEQLAALAAHMAARREPILLAWRKAVDADPYLTAHHALPRSQFNDHIPKILDAYESKLRTWPREEHAASEEQRNEDAAGHGLQRWQQGYNLREVTREWGHLHLLLADELAAYSLAHGSLELEVMPFAWRALAELCSQGVSESTTQYFQLQQTEATGHVRDLEQTLDQFRELEQKRTELFRQAAHDLRGNVGMVENVTWGLTQDSIPEGTRAEFLQLLQTSVTSLHSMLDGVMNLARLQAGHEMRDVKPIDAGVELKDLIENLQPMAAERGLYLRSQGTHALRVDGDAVKIRRIAQNLLLNALKYTQQGGVTVSWGDSQDNDPQRWMLCVKDTGPGYHAGSGAPLAEALQDATIESNQVDESSHIDSDSSRACLTSAPAPASDPRPIYQERGEGIGLSIVKRLCELLDASVELESDPNSGTTIRVVFPRHYDDTLVDRVSAS